MYAYIMSQEMDENDLIRQTIRIHPYAKHRLIKLMKLGRWVTESELIREALNLGLDTIEERQ